MKHWVVSLLFASLALAGCLGGETDAGTDEAGVPEDGSTDGPDGSSADSGADGPTGSGGNGTEGDNATDTGSAPSIERFEANTSEGEVPFDVTFFFNASDPDGDNLTWTLDVDGDGSPDSEGGLLPFNFTTTYDVAGSYEAVLEVSDGTSTVNGTVTITASEPEPEEGPEDEEDEAPALVDRGWYEYDPATGLCHVKDYDDIQDAGVLYESALGGGDWYIAETNDVPGLQISDNHPLGPVGTIPGVGSWAVADTEDCVDGDQILA